MGQPERTLTDTSAKRAKQMAIRVKSMRSTGASLATIADRQRISIYKVCEFLGIQEGDNERAYANIHLGPEQDTTGLFMKIATMKWIAEDKRMSPALAAQVHDMRKGHWSYSRITKATGLKRSTIQSYYYKWLRDNGLKPWGIEEGETSCLKQVTEVSDG